MSGKRKVLVLSYGWHSVQDPDPTGYTDTAVRHYLSTLGEAARELVLFCDFACLPQPPRTEEEQAIFERGLPAMSSLYASIAGTCVIEQKHVPPMPNEYRGKVVCFPPDVSEKRRR